MPVTCQWCASVVDALPGTAIASERRCNPCFWRHRDGGQLRLTQPQPQPIIAPTVNAIPLEINLLTTTARKEVQDDGRKSGEGMAGVEPVAAMATAHSSHSQPHFGFDWSKPNDATEMGGRKQRAKPRQYESTGRPDREPADSGRVAGLAVTTAIPAGYCIAGCGKRVARIATSMKCIDCASEAVQRWKERSQR